MQHGSLPQVPSGLEVTTSFNPLQWVFFFCKPQIIVNGQSYSVPWGRQLAPLPPGHYFVRVQVPYLFGPACIAQTEVDVHPGHVTGLAYDTAFFVFSAGALRHLGARPWG